LVFSSIFSGFVPLHNLITGVGKLGVLLINFGEVLFRRVGIFGVISQLRISQTYGDKWGSKCWKENNIKKEEL
jgi:hypothetical protein